MAKKQFSIGFTKAELFFDENGVTVVEALKEEEKSYDFIEILKSLEGVSGLTIKISHDMDIPSE